MDAIISLVTGQCSIFESASGCFEALGILGTLAFIFLDIALVAAWLSYRKKRAARKEIRRIRQGSV